MVSVIAYNPFEGAFYPTGLRGSCFYDQHLYSYGFHECPIVSIIRQPAANYHPYRQFLEALLPFADEGSDGKAEKKSSSSENPEEKASEGFQVKLSVKSYKPEDFKVTLEGRQVKVSGKTVEKKEEGGWQVSHVKYLSHSYTLPKNIDADKLTTTLSPDGILSIEAPLLPALEKTAERDIPIEFKEPTTPAANSVENDEVVEEKEETEVPVEDATESSENTEE